MNDRLFLLINASTHPPVAAVLLAMTVSRVLPVMLIGGTVLTAVVRRWRAALYRGYLGFLLIGLLLAAAVSWILGRVLYVPRPFAVPVGIHLVRHIDNSAFPSNHVLFMTVYATFFLLAGRPRLAVCFALGTITMAWSRIYLGVHYPLDVVGAVIIGVGATVLAWRMQHWCVDRMR